MVVRKTGLMDIWLTDWLTGWINSIGIGNDVPLVCVYVFALVMCTCIARCLALFLFFVCLQQQQQQLVYCSRCSCMQIGLPLCVRHMASMSATPQAAAAPAAQAHSPNPSSDCARFCLAHLAAAVAALARSGVVLP